MPVHAYLTLKGSKQGDIKGSCDQEGHKGEILVQEFRHEVEIPRDPHSGQPTGRRVHKPMSLTKVFDKASPLLYQALCTGEMITEATLKWYRIKAGTEEHYFTIQIKNGLLVTMKPYMPMCLDPKNAAYEHMEELAFSYEKIIWTWEPDGVQAEDSWKKPAVG
jgi:type VI secretion system secreted protein Hcp